MRWNARIKACFFITLSVSILVPLQSFAAVDAKIESNNISPAVVAKIFEKAKENNDWKHAFLTGKNAQIVFMNISPSTNPSNEVGVETHKFDQVIFVVDGKARASLNGETSMVETGDMIFIPQGVAHNVVNLDSKKPLKIMSVYSDTDIPKTAVYHKKSDTPKE